MNTKTYIISAAIAAALTASPAFAGNYGHHDPYAGGPAHFDRGTERARVTNVVPIRVIERVPVTHRECYDQEVWNNPRGGGVSAGEGMIAGTLIGGVIGNQAVHGKGRNTATVAGSIIGAVVGHAMASDRGAQPYRTVEQRCDVRQSYRNEERIVAYDVTYRYAGKTYTTRMDHDPGKWLPVTVQPY